MSNPGPWWGSARLRGTVLACAVVLVVAVWLVRGPVATLWWTSWGPDRPWQHRDLLGALWLWHAEGHGGTALWLGLQNHPDGAPGVRHHIPNPFDAWLVGPVAAAVGGSIRAWWGATQLAHHLANVLSVVVLTRSTGARWAGGVGAGLLVAASPVMLHEIAGGRGLSGAVWPGLLGIALLFRGNSVWAGVLVGFQGLCYLYTGALVGLIALLLRPSLGLVAGASLVVGPYLAWLSPLLSGLHGRPPPADFSVLPLDGLWGDAEVPARQRLTPWIWVTLAAAIITRRWRWAAASTLAMVVALGPTPGARSDVAVVASPLAWLMAWIPALGRMHHPVRAVLVGIPLLAVVGGRAWPRVTLLAAGLAVVGGAGMQEAAAWGEHRGRPGMAQARWLSKNATGAVVDLTGAGAEALALHPVHGRPILEGLRKPMGPTASGRLRRAADGWLAGQPQPGLVQALRSAGFSHVLVVQRAQPLAPETWAVLASELGAPVYPGIYAVAPPVQTE